MMLRTAFAALALVATTAAFADDHRDHDGDRDRHGHDRGHDRGHDDRGRHDDRRWHDDRGWQGRREPPRYYGHGYYNGPAYYHRPPPPRYYGHWERGHRYYGGNTVVYDYGSYRLRPPPRGYHWVRENNDFLLVAVATGIIFDIATR
jgi:Ni/Co efflux regulator RcnB